jgi:hypothetical protein
MHIVLIGWLYVIGIALTAETIARGVVVFSVGLVPPSACFGSRPAGTAHVQGDSARARRRPPGARRSGFEQRGRRR